MKKIICSLALLGTFAAHSYAVPTVQLRVPERFRLLTGQLCDLRVEGTNLTGDPNAATVQIVVSDGTDVTAGTPPETAINNTLAGQDKSWTYRSRSFATAGVKTVTITVTDKSGPSAPYVQRIGVQNFSFGPSGTLPKKNIILFLGDALGTAYRDAGRIVAESTGGRFRQGFFDQLQAMDTMPVSGMVMTYNIERLVPDSSPTSSAWSTGNKTGDGTHGVFSDNDDFRYSSSNVQATKQFALNNPRIETLWEYLKRLYGYKTGIVSTADITDATPAGDGSHTLTRSLAFDIARQYRDGNIVTPGGGPGAFTTGPVFDVIIGGGREHFDKRDATNSGDTRNFISEFQGLGYTYTATRAQLNSVRGGVAPDRLLGLFYSTVASTDGGLTTGPGSPAVTGANGHMNVAYDKLGLVRSSDEPAPNFRGYTDQPFLDEMTDAAIKTLSKDGAPFILMVEAASIDKQSHPNHAGGVIWDVIELDKSIALGRNFGTNGGTVANTKTLVLVTADHDQSLSLVGITDSTNAGGVLNTRSNSVYPRTITPYDPIIGGALAPSNGGNNVGEVGGFPDYVDQTFSGGVYPNNTNRFKLSVGFRTGNHTAARCRSRPMVPVRSSSAATSIRPTSSSRCQRS